MSNELTALISALAAAASALAAYLALWPYISQFLRARRLSSDFGAELYFPEVIRNATRYYVRPDASSLDLSQELEEPSNRVPTRESLFRAVERFLDDDSEHRHLFLLSDSGMGKSAFVLNFYSHNKRRFALKRYRLVVIPLGYPRVIERIRAVENKRETVIFLDAFDEDPLARPDYWVRLKELLQECSEFKRVLITCRTQFFPKDSSIPVSTGLIKLGPRNDEAHYEFWRLYIAPLSDEQVNQYLKMRYRLWHYRKRKEARDLIQKVPLLTLRPMLLTHIPEILAAKKDVTFTWQLYELMIEAWYRREKDWWQDIDSIKKFSEEVAVQIYLNYLQQKSDRIPRSELTEVIRTLSVPVDEWNATSRSLLHRDAEGNFKFAHRSVMEYLFIKKFIHGDTRCQQVPWTDQMQKFMADILRTPRSFESYAVSIWERFDLIGADLHEADLTEVRLQGKNLSWANFHGADLSYANCRGAIVVGTDFSTARLDRSIFTDARVDVYPYNDPYKPPTFRKASLKHADLSRAILSGANFDEADLTDAILQKTNLRGASVRNASLKNADLCGARLVDADFTESDFTGALLDASRIDVVKTSLKGSNFKNTIGLNGDEISHCEVNEFTDLPVIFDDLKDELILQQEHRNKQ